jgi:hypothetical protein
MISHQAMTNYFTYQYYILLILPLMLRNDGIVLPICLPSFVTIYIRRMYYNKTNSNYSQAQYLGIIRPQIEYNVFLRRKVLENIISLIKPTYIIILTNYCSRCGKRISKWFEIWYAQGNCSCLSVENKTIGTRDEEY